MSVDFLRHSGYCSPEILREPLNVVGVGATGSNIALLAARMGFTRFKIWDPDVVESHNLPNQVYDHHHIGAMKVDALADVLRRFNPEIRVETYPDYFTSEQKQLLDGPLILTVDTMSARQESIAAFQFNPMVKYVFETRLGFEHGELNIIDNCSSQAVKLWANTLLSDDKVPEGPCNQRICTTLVTIVASFTVQLLCGMFVAEKNSQPWQYRTKTVFNLKDSLQVFDFNQK